MPWSDTHNSTIPTQHRKHIMVLTDKELKTHVEAMWQDLRSTTDASRDLHDLAWNLKQAGFSELAEKITVIKDKIQTGALHKLVDVLQERDGL